MIYSVEKMLREHREKIGEAEAKKVEEAVAETRKAMDGGGKDKIQAAMDQLTQASHKLAEAMYKTAGPQPGAQPGAGPTDGGSAGATGEAGPKKDTVVDAEFVDVDDTK